MRAGAALLVMVLVASSAGPAVRPAAPGHTDRRPVEARLDSLFFDAHYDSLLRILPDLTRRAETEADSVLLGRLVFQRGRVEITLGHQQNAQGLFDVAIDIAMACRDTLGLLPALHFRAFVFRDQGHFDAAQRLFEHELDLARRSGNLVSEAAATQDMAYRLLRRGELEAARPLYERALELATRSGNAGTRINVYQGMGLLLRALGETGEARRMHRRAYLLARQIVSPMQELWAINSLGLLEADDDNMELAARYYTRALEIGRRIGFARGQALPLLNQSEAWLFLGDTRRASESLAECLDVCERAGFVDLGEVTVIALAQLRLREGRPRAAAELLRPFLAGTIYAEERRDAGNLMLAMALADVDSVEAAVAVLEPFVSRPGEAPSLILQPYLELTYAQLLLRLGKYEAGLDVAVGARGTAARENRTELAASAQLVESACLHGLDRTAEAVTALYAALDSLEVARRDLEDAEWREAFGREFSEDIVATCRVVLDHPSSTTGADGETDFYDTLQRFKTRTLLERIHDPRSIGSDSAAPRTVTHRDLQERILADGDLVLDFFAGRNETFLFAIGRRQWRMTRLPGTHSALAEQMSLFRDVVASPSADTRGAYPAPRIAAMQAALGNALFAGVADLIASSQRLYIAADGRIAAIPVGTLIVGGDGRMLLEDHDVIQIPSVGVLEWVRSAHPPAGEGAGVVALAPAGTGLRGASDEVGSLDRHYRDVAVVRGLAGGIDSLLQVAAHHGILHVAAHAIVNDDSPWQSRFDFETPTGTDGHHERGGPAAGGTAARARADSLAMAAEFRVPSELRAWEIARVSLPVQIAVLSGCETAGGSLTTGEGVLGLTSAFLSAGVPAVVASQWPVDDRVTADLMRRFYERLARGEAVAAALRGAQLEIRARRATSHPFYWAGFTVVGDGGRVAHLERAAHPARPTAVLSIIALVGLGVLALRRRRTGTAARQSGAS
ncbi:MAG TPA: CHAT domain-containing protein [Candidatus Krumholzibacteria bacterium]|nr:CHAT domain-containing protein [Candidatus Krumholzibacteria bacterium]